MKCIYLSLRSIAVMLIAMTLTATAAKKQLPDDIARMLTSYNVKWDTPSRSGSMESPEYRAKDVTIPDQNNLRPRKKLGLSNPKSEFFKKITNFALAS
ncbi:MAG: hypothetical protein K1V87_05365 [Muribaculum sp.]